MKKIFCSIMTFLLLFLCSCENQNNKDDFSVLGTWNVSYVKIGESQFTLEELESLNEKYGNSYGLNSECPEDYSLGQFLAYFHTNP